MSDHRSGVDRSLLDRLIVAVEAMPDFAGRTARDDGCTHQCSGCGAWMYASAVYREGRDGSLYHYRYHYREQIPCGSVYDRDPVEGVLRSDVIAVIRRVFTEEEEG